MIRLIRGTVAEIGTTSVVIDVQGVGYEVHVTIPATTFALGIELVLHTHLAVRENALDLYGFSDRDTLDVFELLLTLPKIGPKSAQQILSQADTALLKQAVRNGDASYLSKMSGIGKKSAEKIVAGLRDKFEEQDASYYDPTSTTDPDSSLSYARDTIDALVALGYAPEDARRAVRQVGVEHPEITRSTDALKQALKLLSN